MTRSGKVCPLCGTASGRHWLRSSIWARWSCAGCGRILRFDARRRAALLALCGLGIGPLVLVVLSVLLRHRPMHLTPPWLVAGTMVFALAAKVTLFTSLDRVEVAVDTDPGVCSACGYDIRVQQADGLGRCPECGRPIP